MNSNCQHIYKVENGVIVCRLCNEVDEIEKELAVCQSLTHARQVQDELGAANNYTVKSREGKSVVYSRIDNEVESELRTVVRGKRRFCVVKVLKELKKC